MPDRFYVIETRGYTIASGGRPTVTELASFAVLDRLWNHREVATFAAVPVVGGNYGRKMNAQTRCAELNAWAMGHR